MGTIKKFLNPEQVLYRVGVTLSNVVVDLGAGSGHFAMAAAKLVGEAGKVIVVDVLETALEHVSAEARLTNQRNIQTIRHDLEKGEISGIATGQADVVIVANVLHQVQPAKVFLESYRILKTSGKLLVIDWNANPTPIGPKAEQRVTETELQNLATKHNLKFKEQIETDQYHYGLIFIK